MENEEWRIENWGGGGNGQDVRCPSGGKRNGQDVRCPSGGELSTGFAPTAKKTEGKKRTSPSTPKEKKGRVKKHSRGFSKKPSFACGRGRIARALDAELDAAAAAFRGTAEDRRLWAAIAWRVGVAEFHYAVADKMREDAADGQPEHPAAAFQAFLNRRFPNPPSPRPRRMKGGTA